LSAARALRFLLREPAPCALCFFLGPAM